MEWTVMKVGADMFDALHAYGLAMTLTYASGTPVELKDVGLGYRLMSSSTDTWPKDNQAILSDILTLPTPTQLQAEENTLAAAPVWLTTLDGWLAALFTVPGVRLVSVFDLFDKQKARPAVVEAALAKVKTAVSTWKRFVERTSGHSAGWLMVALQDYDPLCPRLPYPDRKRSGDLGILMTLDPSFSYSTCRARSDGLITDKTNLAIRGPRYAALFALIGASRFLRAQRVANNLVNFYVPLIDSAILGPETTMPSLYATRLASERAMIYRWLASSVAHGPNLRLNGLAYQVMQTQGASQSISISRGCLDYAWLTTLAKQAETQILKQWKFMMGQERLPFETDHLLDALMQRSSKAWINHLRELSLYLHSHPQADIRAYHLKEVKEVTKMMIASENSPLRSVLERDQGTLRFGHALRLLGRVHQDALRDIIDHLDLVRTSDQLIRVLAIAVQECAVAGAKSEFIIIPDDEDLKYLLADLEQHSAPTLAGLLIILSALRYPRLPDAADAELVLPQTEQGRNNDRESTDHL